MIQIPAGRWATLAVLPLLLAAGAEPPTGYVVPGRNPDSLAPWEVFLGNAAHRLIAYMYQVNHPTNKVYCNNVSLAEILRDSRAGNPSRLLDGERQLQPDITDIDLRTVFEIKPWNDGGISNGLREVQVYLAALNRTVTSGRGFVGGIDFHGEVLIRFAQGQHIWRLNWQTTEPGLTLYRWTRSKEQFASEKAAYEAHKWVELSKEEMQKYGGWVAQAVEGMVSRRESLASLRGTIGLVIDVIGTVAVGAFSGIISGQIGSRPPAQGGGQVIPFPTKPPPVAPSAPVPAASGI